MIYTLEIYKNAISGDETGSEAEEGEEDERNEGVV